MAVRSSWRRAATAPRGGRCRARGRRPGARAVVRARVAPQQGAHPGQQLGEGEGLDEVVVGAVVEARHAVLERVAGGEHEHAGLGLAIAGGSARIWRQTSRPSMPGMVRSRHTRSYSLMAETVERLAARRAPRRRRSRRVAGHGPRPRPARARRRRPGSSPRKRIRRPVTGCSASDGWPGRSPGPAGPDRHPTSGWAARRLYPGLRPAVLICRPCPRPWSLRR